MHNVTQASKNNQILLLATTGCKHLRQIKMNTDPAVISFFEKSENINYTLKK